MSSEKKSLKERIVFVLKDVFLPLSMGLVLFSALVYIVIMLLIKISEHYWLYPELKELIYFLAVLAAFMIWVYLDFRLEIEKVKSRRRFR